MSFDQLLLVGESQTLEFKSSFDKATVESLAAFANAQGGTVFVGVSDADLIHGVRLGKETLNEWLGQIKSATSPSFIPDLMAKNTDGKILVIIYVSELPVKLVSTRGRYFKRVASSKHQLGLAEIANLYMQSLQLSWDVYEAPNEFLDALSLFKINRFISQVNDTGRFALEGEPLVALKKFKYIDNGHPTWADLLLFVKKSLRYHIHIGRFKTASMIIDDRQIIDTLFEAVDQAMKFIVSHINVAFEFDGSLQRKERFACPLPALRDALFNAVVHRDYTNPSDIQIKIFDDSITFFSPGRFYGELSVADIHTDSCQLHLRNKLVAEAFYLTNNIEKYGSGFIRIRKALQDYPEASFKVQEIGGGVLLTFKRIGARQPEESGVAQRCSEKILSLLRKFPTFTTREVAQQLGISPRAVEKQIDKKLKCEGNLRWVGPDKAGYWQVLEAY